MNANTVRFIKGHDASGLLRELEAAEIILASELDLATLASTEHWERFLLRVASFIPDQKLKVGDVFSNEDLEAIYQGTAKGDLTLH